MRGCPPKVQPSPAEKSMPSKKNRLRRVAIFAKIIMSVLITGGICTGQAQATWLCNGADPDWNLNLSPDSTTWWSEDMAATFGKFDKLEPSRPTNRGMWVYQLAGADV